MGSNRKTIRQRDIEEVGRVVFSAELKEVKKVLNDLERRIQALEQARLVEVEHASESGRKQIG